MYTLPAGYRAVTFGSYRYYYYGGIYYYPYYMSGRTVYVEIDVTSNGDPGPPPPASSFVEEASSLEEVLAGAASPVAEASLLRPPVSDTSWYKRVKSAPVSPFVLVILYSVEEPNPDAFETEHLSITDRLLSQTLEYIVPSTVPWTS